MKSKVLVWAVGLAVAGLMAALVLLGEGSKVVESLPHGVEHESVAPSAPVVAPAPPVVTLETPDPGSVAARETPAAAEVRSEIAAPLIRGRVVEADGGLARPGIELRLESRSELIASALTDAAGRFELPYSNANRLAVELVEPDGWKAVRRRQRLSASQPPGEELVFELRPIPGVVFRGRVVDESNGDLLPYLKLSVGSGFSLEVLMTDGDGLFTTKRRHEAEDVEVALVISGGGRGMHAKRTIAFDGTSRIHAVPMPIGPTYDLEVAAPPGYGVEDLRGFLGDMAEICPWKLTAFWTQGEPVHSDTSVWVRFLDDLTFDAEGSSATLWLATADHRWLGSCKVPPHCRRGGGPYAFSLVPCGSVEVRISRPAALRDLELAVDLQRPGRDPCWGPRREAERDGSYHFDLVPTGDYVVTAASARIQRIERTVHVAAGEPTLVDIALESLPVAGSISGVVRTQGGRHKATEQVSLVSSDHDAEAITAEVHWEQQSGALVGQFVFEDVPAGQYELSSRYHSNFEWRCSAATVSPPAADLELLCLDGAGGISLSLEAFDASTKKPLDRVSCDYESSVSGSASYTVSGSNTIPLDRFPSGVALEWTLASDGYLPITGDLSSFKQVGTQDGEPILRARVELKPGWGGHLEVRSGPSVVAEAIVLCDGIEVGRTDTAGGLDIALPSRPRHFEVRHPSYVMWDPPLGELPNTAYAWGFHVEMKPRE